MNCNRSRAYTAVGLAVIVSIPSFATFAAPPLVVNEPVPVPSSAEAQTAVMEYWTPERIASATAMVMVDTGQDNADEMGFFEDEADLDATAKVQKTRGGRAEKGASAFHRQAYPDDWEKLEEDMGVFYMPGDDLPAALDNDSFGDAFSDDLAGTRSVFAVYIVNKKSTLWKIYPHRWQGKLTFTTPNGSASCSATAISKNHVVTAAHCVYDTSHRNRWYTNKAFHPAYRNGSKPYGTFATTGCSILGAWVNLSGNYSINRWARYDVAVCGVGRNSAGKTLNQAVGYAGRSWNFAYEQLHFNAGYPARDYRDNMLVSPAQYLRSCTAESFKQTAETLGMGCLYGRGISGGSWLLNYKANYTTAYVNGVNSGLYLGQSNLYGPRFNSNNIVVLCNTQGC